MAGNQSNSTRIVVIGGGVIGLTTALALLEDDFKHVQLISESFDDTTSHGAGAVWRPFALPSHISTHRIRRWCEDTFSWLEKLMAEHGKEKVGIHMLQGYEVEITCVPPVTHPYWAHIVKNFQVISPEHANKIWPGGIHGIKYGSFLIHPKTFMDWARHRISTLGGTFEQRKVDSLDSIDCDLLINCTGIASRTLAKDESVYPIRGQTIKIFNPDIKNFFTIKHEHNQFTYILPRPNGEVVLGGTVQPENWNTQNDEKDISEIWERCCTVVPEIRNSKVLGQWAGLRPQRMNGIRLEVDPHRTTMGAVLIHNYGHAGSGHTLHWGCALDVVRLAKKQIAGSSSVEVSRL